MKDAMYNIYIYIYISNRYIYLLCENKDKIRNTNDDQLCKIQVCAKKKIRQGNTLNTVLKVVGM